MKNKTGCTHCYPHVGVWKRFLVSGAKKKTKKAVRLHLRTYLRLKKTLNSRTPGMMNSSTLVGRSVSPVGRSIIPVGQSVGRSVQSVGQNAHTQQTRHAYILLIVRTYYSVPGYYVFGTYWFREKAMRSYNTKKCMRAAWLSVSHKV